MRLIGIQALLGLLQHIISAKADAHGIGLGTVAISNAGVVGNAPGIGSISAVGVAIGAISGVGFASAFGTINGIGAGTGLFIGVGAAAGHGTSAATGANNVIGGTALAVGSGVAIGKPASTGAASGTGAASAVGFATGVNASVGSAAGVGAGAATAGPANAFLARTSGLDSTHTTAYTNLINGLVTDGVWSKLDVLYIWATQDSTTALLNLVSSSFGGVTHGSPAFVADRGFTGVDASSTVYIDSQFNPTTAPTPKFITNSCHLSNWADTNLQSGSSGGQTCGATGATTNNSGISPWFSDNKAYIRINDGPPSVGFSNTNSTGHWVASRTGSSVSVGYKNGSVFASPNAASGTLGNFNIIFLATSLNGAATFGSGLQLPMGSIGGGLTGTDVTNFYNRLRTYMTAVGVP